MESTDVISQYWMYILGIFVVIVGAILGYMYFRGKFRGGMESGSKTQEVLMVMPEGKLVSLHLPLDYASSYTNCWMEVNNIRRSWLVLHEFQRTIRGTKRNKIIADYRSLVPYSLGVSSDKRKKDLVWADEILTQIGKVQHDMTAFLAPKMEIKNKLRDNLITMGLIGAIGVVIISILFVVLK